MTRPLRQSLSGVPSYRGACSRVPVRSPGSSSLTSRVAAGPAPAVRTRAAAACAILEAGARRRGTSPRHGRAGWRSACDSPYPTTAERDQQLAHALAVATLWHFRLQLPALMHRLARRFVPRCWHVNHVHAATLATQPRAQVDGQFDGTKPIRFRALLVALDRNTSRINDLAPAVWVCGTRQIHSEP